MSEEEPPAHKLYGFWAEMAHYWRRRAEVAEADADRLARFAGYGLDEKSHWTVFVEHTRALRARD